MGNSIRREFMAARGDRDGGLAAPKAETSRRRPKFEVYGEELIEKVVRQSGKSGRVYLPPEWVGKCVKIIRVS